MTSSFVRRMIERPDIKISKTPEFAPADLCFHHYEKPNTLNQRFAPE
jgi:hypothetical protein